MLTKQKRLISVFATADSPKQGVREGVLTPTMNDYVTTEKIINPS